MKKIGAALALLGLLASLAGCDGQYPPLPPAPQQARPTLPANCQWIHLQGTGIDDQGHTYSFQWDSPLCLQRTTGDVPGVLLFVIPPPPPPHVIIPPAEEHGASDEK